MLFAALLAGANPVVAQQAGGAIGGRVTDAAGEPLAGARVSAEAGAGRTQVGTTDARGEYRLPDLPAGTYTVRVEKPGFRAVERRREVTGGAAVAADFTLAESPVELSGLEVVSATRSSTPIAAIPGAVTVIGREEIQREMTVARGLGEILGKQVPGLAIGTQSMSNFGQSLRGRNVVVLIDGVPQSTLRNVSRDFATLDPAMIERVEVLRGATALYGDGATGGVINIATRRPGTGAPLLSTDVSADGSLSNPGDGVGGRLTQGISGKEGAIDYVASVSATRTSGFYDAEGDLIPADPHGQGGLADTDSYDLFGKTGWEFGEQRLQLSANHFRSEQETEFTADPSVNALAPGEAKARALPGLREDEHQGTRNTVLSLDYTHADWLGSRIHGQLFYRDYLTRFRPFDRRRFDKKTGALLSGQVSQSFVDSEKWGGRLEAESRLFGDRGPSLVWGADYTYEDTSQPVGIMDAAVYDASNGLEFRKTGERIWVPPLRPRSLGLFAQVGWNLTDQLLLRGGVRRERVRMHVDDFVTLDDARVFGGDLAYDPTLFNVGAVLGSEAAVNVFANYSQGFSLADVGRILRAASDGFDLGANRLEAPTVEHYEIGARGAWSSLEASLAVFRSTSELGTRLVQAESGMLEIARSPERIRGAEATLDVHPTDRLSVGGVWSWTEGEAFNETVEEYRALDGYRIQPMKLTAYLEHRTGPEWRNRVQVLHSGDRGRAFRDRVDPARPAGYGEQPIRGYTVVDLLSSIGLGRGTLQLGVQNLLNEQYFDTVSQLDLTDGNAYYTAARGAALTVGYSVTY